MNDSLKAARKAAKARGVDYLFNASDASSAPGGESNTALLYARESNDITNEAIAELRRMHGNESEESETIPRFWSFSPWDEPLPERADLEENETRLLTEPEQ